MANPQNQLSLPWTVAPDKPAAPDWIEGDLVTLSNAPGTVWEIIGIERLSAYLLSISPTVGTRRTAPLWLLRPASVVSGAELIVAPDTESGRRAKTKHHHWVETYSPAKRDTTYYRYVWMDGRKLHHLHISGGNTKSAIALENKAQVEKAIASGVSPDVVAQLLKSWRQPPT